MLTFYLFKFLSLLEIFEQLSKKCFCLLIVILHSDINYRIKVLLPQWYTQRKITHMLQKETWIFCLARN